MLTGVGLEPKVVGTAFALGANKMSAPIREEYWSMLLKT
jgi:peptidyl-prolyl cis-trans isomerase D